MDEVIGLQTILENIEDDEEMLSIFCTTIQERDGCLRVACCDCPFNSKASMLRTNKQLETLIEEE